MKYLLRTLSFASDFPQPGPPMTLKHWEVVVPGSPSPACILAYTKSQAIQTAIELFPGINPCAVTIRQLDQWT